MSICEKLLRIQKSLIVSKDNKNAYGGFNYRTLSDILVKLKPLLADEHCTLFFDDDIRLVDEYLYVVTTATITDIITGEKLTTHGLARETKQKTKWDEGQLTGSASSYARKYALAGLLLIDDSKDIDSWQNGEDTVSAPASPSQQKKKGSARVSDPVPSSAPASVSASPVAPARVSAPASPGASDGVSAPVGDVVPVHDGEGLSDEQVKYLLELMNKKGERVEKVLKSYRVDRLNQLSSKQYVGLVNGLAQKENV